MRKYYNFKLSNSKEFIEKLLEWSKQFHYCCLLHSNQQHEAYPKEYQNVTFLFAVDSLKDLQCDKESFGKLKEFHESNNDWLFGYLSYDLKNELEELNSNNKGNFNTHQLHFFIPKYVFKLQDNCLTIESYADLEAVKLIFQEILSTKYVEELQPKISFKKRENKKEYIRKINKIKAHIQQGDIYEMNFCQEFFSEKTQLNPESLYLQLNEMTITPFSSFLHLNHHYVAGASPERFLRKKGTVLLSQPIKGTRKRGTTKKEDKHLRLELENSEKDKVENIMITDLVRNDLSKTAQKASVKVEELCKVYSFEGVHQMITSISSTIDKKTHFTEVLKTTFPMGSMTGTPKIKAMELIEYYESTKRGVFSGAVGYITPDGDFDFNVVIRSVLYNRKNKYLSVSVGGAITINSTPEQEYEECLLKAKKIFELFNYSANER